MPYKPVAENGAIYPPCGACAADDVPVYFVDVTSDVLYSRFNNLPKGTTAEQVKAMVVPEIICEACSVRLKAPLLQEYPWTETE